VLIQPSIDSLLEKVENKYALVVLSAARARQLREALLTIDPDNVDDKDVRLLKEVSVALEEVDKGKIDFSFLDNYLEEMQKVRARVYQKQEDEEE
jgi:DNA-directed RNA polymerase subunit omega